MTIMQPASFPSGLEQLRSWIASDRQPPMRRTLNVNLVEADHGRAVLAGTPGEQVYNPLGILSAGTRRASCVRR
jgi:hypothetical protein